MSQENVEIVRKLYAAWERGDYASTEFMAPDIVYFERDAYLDTQPVIQGREACVKAMSEFGSTFQEFNPIGRAVVPEVVPQWTCGR